MGMLLMPKSSYQTFGFGVLARTWPSWQCSIVSIVRSRSCCRGGTARRKILHLLHLPFHLRHYPRPRWPWHCSCWMYVRTFSNRRCVALSSLIYAITATTLTFWGLVFECWSFDVRWAWGHAHCSPSLKKHVLQCARALTQTSPALKTTRMQDANGPSHEPSKLATEAYTYIYV